MKRVLDILAKKDRHIIRTSIEIADVFTWVLILCCLFRKHNDDANNLHEAEEYPSQWLYRALFHILHYIHLHRFVQSLTKFFYGLASSRML